MAERKRLPTTTPASKRAGGNYFPQKDKPLTFIHSGCTVLDCILGGGWPLGRIANIVGDKSTGKTLLAIEASANFAKQFPNGKIYYREAEAAFDEAYAVRLGLPIKQVSFGSKGLQTKWGTIEDVFRDLRKKVSQHAASGLPGLYIVDSLDALSSEAARNREVGEGSYNLEKPKMLSLMFSELASEIKAASLCVMIISQTRHRIGFVVGEKHRRSGGDALDFYASQILWLKHLKNIDRTYRGEKRIIGIRVIANCKKNKITDPFQKCTFDIRFGYGIHDIAASIDWLQKMNMTKRLGLTPKQLDACVDLDLAEAPVDVDKINTVVRETWKELGDHFAPKQSKYA